MKSAVSLDPIGSADDEGVAWSERHPDAVPVTRTVRMAFQLRLRIAGEFLEFHCCDLGNAGFPTLPATLDSSVTSAIWRLSGKPPPA